MRNFPKHGLCFVFLVMCGLSALWGFHTIGCNKWTHLVEGWKYSGDKGNFCFLALETTGGNRTYFFFTDQKMDAVAIDYTLGDEYISFSGTKLEVKNFIDQGSRRAFFIVTKTLDGGIESERVSPEVFAVTADGFSEHAGINWLRTGNESVLQKKPSQ